MVPSTCPSIVRSSLPFNSPLITTDLPMFTLLSITFAGPTGVGAGEEGAVAAGCGTAGCPLAGRTDSSRFHMLDLRQFQELDVRVSARQAGRWSKNRVSIGPDKSVV